GRWARSSSTSSPSWSTPSAGWPSARPAPPPTPAATPGPGRPAGRVHALAAAPGRHRVRPAPPALPARLPRRPVAAHRHPRPLPANWKHLPVGYHGRAGTVDVSGTPVVRPCGQRREDDGPAFGPSRRLDVEAEVGFVVGTPTGLGTRVPVEAFTEHVFGACLVNDWSARDLQAWEYVPLGPFLGKSFLTSVAPWVVPLAALEAARVRPPERDPEPLPYLDDGDDPWGLDITLEVRLNGE